MDHPDNRFATYGSFVEDLLMQIRYGGYPPIKIVWVFGKDPRKKSLQYVVQLNESNCSVLFYKGGDEAWFSETTQHATGYVSVERYDDHPVYFFSDADTALLFKLRFGA